jgi:hypothetical protein
MKNWRPSEGDAVSNNTSLQSPINMGSKFRLQLKPRCCIHTILRSKQGNNSMVHTKSTINWQMSSKGWQNLLMTKGIT